MILAAAQTKPVSNNTEKNIRHHLQLIELAAERGVQLIVFPEMSLTGYERELANQLAFTENDPRLIVFKEKAVAHNMIIIAGAPVKIDVQLHIGSFIFFPNDILSVYTKQFLHDGEEKFFSPSFNFNALIGLEDEKISIAICADIANPLHPGNAAKNNTTLYVAGIFYTPDGITEGHEQLCSYAKKYNMNVLMANYSGTSYNFESAGQSAFWNNSGELIGKLGADEEGLLIAERSNGSWKTKQVKQEERVNNAFK